MPFTANLNLTALCRSGRLKEALQILLTTHNPPADSYAYFHLLQTCISRKALFQGKQIHSYINQTGFQFATHILLQNTLIRMYDKSGCLVDARQVFDQMTERDLFSWNIIIAAYSRHGFPQEALTLFHQMQGKCIRPDQFTFASILPACAKLRALEEGIDIHQLIVESGLLSDVVVASALVDMYVKCGSIHQAQNLFDKMSQRDVVSWTAIIAGYTQNGLVEKALETFKQMQLAGVKPDSTTFASILPACAKMGALEQGMGIHQSIRESGFLSNVVVASALVDMYAKCGSICKAHKLFHKMPQRDVVSWNAMITGYAQNGFVEKAVEAFKQMQLSGVNPDTTTFATVLPACAKMGALEQGMDIHQNIMESGFLSHVVVASALVDMYAKCGSIQKAHELFDKMPQRDVFSWNALIVGYAQNALVKKAMETFKQMQLADVKPDSTTFASILTACSKMGALEQGMDIHRSIMESGFLSNVVVANALLDMYAKCGSTHKARELFNKMPQRDVISWNAMIAGYAYNGFCKDAFKLFKIMTHSRTYPDHASFICVLLACSHAGLVNQGCKYFNAMCESYCITSTVDHYVCMVDILGRAGYLEETLNFIIKMPTKPAVLVWRCLLGACKAHRNIGLGIFTATVLLELDPQNAAAYVLLSNIHAEVGRWDEVQMTNPTHKICVNLEKLYWEMKAAGYFPDSKHLLSDMEEKERELFVCHHSEKLAIVLGLLYMPFETTSRVIKNLHTCVDCHTATKFTSEIVAREIVVRDANWFHLSKIGQCSCGDDWKCYVKQSVDIGWHYNKAHCVRTAVIKTGPGNFRMYWMMIWRKWWRIGK